MLKLKKEKIKNIMSFIYILFVIFCLTYRDRTDESSKLLLFWPGFILLLVGNFCSFILLFNNHSQGYRFNINVVMGFILLCCYILMSSITKYNELIFNLFTMNMLTMTTILIFILNINLSITYISSIIARMLASLAVLFSLLAILINYNFIKFEIGSFILEPNPIHFPRLSGISGEPTSIGGMAGIGILCLIYLLYNNAHWIKKLIYILFISLLIVVIILTGSRMSIVSLMVSSTIMIYLFGGIKEIIKIYFLYVIASFIAIALFCYIYEDNLIISLIKLFRPDDITQEGTRLNIWTNSIGIFYSGSLQETLLGRGFQGLRSIYRSAHNTYLEFLVDNGLFFFALFIIYIYLLYRKLNFALKNNSSRPSSILIVSLLTYALIFSFYLSVLISKNFHIINFIFILTIIMISRLNIKVYLKRDNLMRY